MFKFINKLLSNGVHKELSSDEIKNVRLLNAGCITWFPLNILFICEDLLLNPNPVPNVLTFAGTACFVGVIFYLQFIKKYSIARVTFLLLSLAHFMVFCIFLEPGSLLEYFLILTPIFALIFFNNVRFSLIAFILSFVCFTATIVSFGNYNGVEFQHFANFALFLAIYLSFVYLKRLNIKSEKLLEEQRNEAIEASNKIEKQRLELEELNRFQSTFWVNLSHELKTPLTLIKGSSNQLMRTELDAKSKQQVHRINNNTNKIQELIDDIMDLAKMRVNKLELDLKVININKLCGNLMNSFQPVFNQKNIKYRFNSSKKNLYAKADKLYLERALSNVILNAYKYSDNFGDIELSINTCEHLIEIEVGDTGCGIESQELDKIFDSFYRAKSKNNEAEGTGIGLSFTKEVIDLHRGVIEVSSDVNQGSIFRITLPLEDSKTYSEDQTFVKSNQVLDYSKTKVLLVEDNSEMRSYIKEVLCGFEVIEAQNGMEAMRKLDSYTPDLIITDYMMPEMDGFEMVQRLRLANNDTPVIVLTARSDEEAKMDFLRLGIDDYLTKPFNEEELMIRIRHAINNNNERISFNRDTLSELVVRDESIKLKELVETNIKSSQFGVMDLADMLSLTERTLHRKIKASSGLTPNGFIREVRLQKANVLCKSGEVNSLKELAQEVGFVNTNHLSKLYLSRFGSKPEFKSKMNYSY